MQKVRRAHGTPVVCSSGSSAKPNEPSTSQTTTDQTLVNVASALQKQERQVKAAAPLEDSRSVTEVYSGSGRKRIDVGGAKRATFRPFPTSRDAPKTPWTELPNSSLHRVHSGGDFATRTPVGMPALRRMRWPSTGCKSKRCSSAGWSPGMQRQRQRKKGQEGRDDGPAEKKGMGMLNCP